MAKQEEKVQYPVNVTMNRAQYKQWEINKQCPLMFNNIGWEPTKVEYFLPLQQLEKLLKVTATEALGGEVYAATIALAPTGKGYPICAIWFRKDSKHLVEKASGGPDVLIQADTDKISDELRRFYGNYGATHTPQGEPINKKKLPVYPGDGPDKHLSWVPISFKRLVEKYFDTSNRGHIDTFNNRDIRTCSLGISVVREGKRDGESGKLLGFNFTKFHVNSRDNTRPTMAFAHNRKYRG